MNDEDFLNEQYTNFLDEESFTSTRLMTSEEEDGEEYDYFDD